VAEQSQKYTLTIEVEPEEPVVDSPVKIKGKLFKTETGEPVANADITVKILKGTELEKELKTKTDENGEYVVEYTFTEPTFRTIYAIAEFEEIPAKPPTKVPAELIVASGALVATALALILVKKKKKVEVEKE